MTNISALLHFLVWIKIQKYHFRCVPTLVDLWVYLVDVWSSHIWWPFANGLVSQMSRHLHCFNARVVPEELSNRRMVPLFRFLFSCVLFQPEFVGPFFPPCKGGSAVPILPKIQGLTPAWIFFEGFVHIHSKVIIYHQKVIFSHKRLCPKEHILFFREVLP